LCGKPFSRAPGWIAASRTLISGCGREKRPHALLIRDAAKVSAAPFLDFTMTCGARQTAEPFAQATETEGQKKMRRVVTVKR
jgi:hypothetical protein